MEHHSAEAELFESARAGCIICTHLSEVKDLEPCDFRFEHGRWKHETWGTSFPAASSESRPPGIASLEKVFLGAGFDINHFMPAPGQEVRVRDAMQCHYQERTAYLLLYKGTTERNYARSDRSFAT